jgi:hypothetical protein
MNKMAVLVPVWFVAASFASFVWGQEKRPLTISGEGVKGRYVQQHVIDMDDAASISCASTKPIGIIRLTKRP